MSTTTAEIPRNVIPVTPEGHRLLREQLAELSTVGRMEASERVRQAREDEADPTENPELMYALQAQERLERRIAELESQLARVQVLDDPVEADGAAALGSRLRVERVGSSQPPMELEIVSSPEADPASGRISVESPVGEALLGRRAGETVTVETPGGLTELRLVEVDGARAA